MGNNDSPNGRVGISIIIPTYERAHMVCEAIESALSQTLPPLEIIVVDDGSTDGTASVLKKYGDRIIYRHQKNLGVSAARNLGLSLAKGGLIAFLDSDDLWDPRKLEYQVKVLQRLPEVHLLFTDFGIRKQDGTLTPAGTSRWFPGGTEYSDLYDTSLCCRELGIDMESTDLDRRVYFGRVFDRMLHLPYGLLSTAMLRRKVVDAGLRFTDGVSLYEDWEFFARVAKSHAVGFLGMEMAFNRSHRGVERLTLKPSIQKTQSYLGVLDRVWKADTDFVSRHAPTLRKLEANALLVLARDAALAGDEKTTRTALERWHSLEMTSGQPQAWLYKKCVSTGSGRALLKNLLRARTLVRIITGSARKGRYSCAPG